MEFIDLHGQGTEKKRVIFPLFFFQKKGEMR